MRASIPAAALPGAALLARSVVSGAGHADEATCDASGIVPRSTHPVGRAFGQGAGTTVSDGRETIDLGPPCDALRARPGPGTWGRSGGGFLVTFPKGKIAVPRQAPRRSDEPRIDIDPCRL